MQPWTVLDYGGQPTEATAALEVANKALEEASMALETTKAEAQRLIESSIGC